MAGENHASNLDQFPFVDPYSVFDVAESESPFWAEQIADLVEERHDADPIVVKGGISPSGVPHLGNMNEVVRGYFVAEVLRNRGYAVEQVFTLDDRDPLRGLPRTLADLDGNLVDLGDVDAGALGRNLGSPYTAIPDPFGCCESYGEHFSRLIDRSAARLDVPLRLESVTELYESGRLDEQIKRILSRADIARAVLADYQDKVDESYVPFNPICEYCGKITETVTAVHLADETVEYECTDMEAGEQTIEGCGHVGRTSIRSGKLPWRFEWPAEWAVLSVDFEPFGKDHAEGSWPSGQHIARSVLEILPPVPMVYEWFTLNGKPFSSSSGHVVLVEELLELIEPEVLKFFFAKDPRKARDFDIENIDRLVADFDRLEHIYFGKEGDEDAEEREYAQRVYPLLVEGPEEAPIRIPYRFAAILGMTDDPSLRRDIAVREGHLPDPDSVPAVSIEVAMQRVERARRWAQRVENEYNYVLQRSSMPEVEVDDRIAAALDELATVVETTDDPEEIQGAIFDIARDHELDVGEFFAIGYRLLFDQDTGPKLGPFLARLDTQFVVDRLRRER